MGQAEQSPRIAIISLFGECNAFRAPIPQAAYDWMAYYEGDSLLDAVNEPDVFLNPDIRGFFDVMNASGAWTPVPLLVAASASGPPLEDAHFRSLMRALTARLENAGRIDGVFIAGHGSVITETIKDVDAVLLGLVRTAVGDKAPIVETLDPHGKVTPEMLRHASLLISYRTDPHVDIYERGQEAATAMRRLLAGEKIASAYIRLPIMIPTVGMVAPNAPFKTAVELGVSRLAAPIANVSILPSYPWTDTPFAGFHVLVSSWADPAASKSLAHELATFIWERRAGFVIEPLSMEQFRSRIAMLNRDSTLAPVCFADIADNPGGGAKGNTMYALQMLVESCAAGAVVGPIFEPRLAALAHASGVGAELEVEFNVGAEDEFTKRYAATVRVEALSDGITHPRSGVARGVHLDQGPTAALRIGGVTVVVNSKPLQALALEQFECVGVDFSKVRLVVVKSRGHYQASFSEFFTRDRMVEIDAPGWTTPHLELLPYANVPRPLYPMDPDTTWTPQFDHVSGA